MTAHVLISGFVQGVGYRRFVKHHAVRLRIRGFVTNLPDKKVEAMFEGDKQDIEKLIDLCRKGPFISEVDKVSVEWGNEENRFQSFEVIK